MRGLRISWLRNTVWLFLCNSLRSYSGGGFSRWLGRYSPLLLVLECSDHVLWGYSRDDGNTDFCSLYFPCWNREAAWWRGVSCWQEMKGLSPWNHSDFFFFSWSRRYSEELEKREGWTLLQLVGRGSVKGAGAEVVICLLLSSCLCSLLAYSCRLKVWEGSQEEHSPRFSIHSDCKAVARVLADTHSFLVHSKDFLSCLWHAFTVGVGVTWDRSRRKIGKRIEMLWKGSVKRLQRAKCRRNNHSEPHQCLWNKEFWTFPESPSPSLDVRGPTLRYCFRFLYLHVLELWEEKDTEGMGQWN